MYNVLEYSSSGLRNTGGELFQLCHALGTANTLEDESEFIEAVFIVDVGKKVLSEVIILVRKEYRSVMSPAYILIIKHEVVTVVVVHRIFV